MLMHRIDEQLDDNNMDYNELPGQPGKESFNSREQQDKFLGGGGTQQPKTPTVQNKVFQIHLKRNSSKEYDSMNRLAALLMQSW
jgi:hypothetical protein